MIFFACTQLKHKRRLPVPSSLAPQGFPYLRSVDNAVSPFKRNRVVHGEVALAPRVNSCGRTGALLQLGFPVLFPDLGMCFKDSLRLVLVFVLLFVALLKKRIIKHAYNRH